MKRIFTRISVMFVLVLLASNSAWAIIDRLEFGGNEFASTSAVKVPQSSNSKIKVYGGGTDLAREIDVSGGGITGSVIERKHGIGSNITIELNISKDAAATERTVTIKYPLGQDTFKIKVIRVGRITEISFRRPIRLSSSAIADVTDVASSAPDFSRRRLPGPTSAPSPATNLPLDEKVILVVNGTKLNNVALYESSSNFSAAILPGGTETRLEIEAEFFRAGTYKIFLVADEAKNDPNKGLFFYEGFPDRAREVTARRSPDPNPADATPCISDPTPSPVTKIAPENNAAVTIDNGANRARVTLEWNFSQLSSEAQRDKLIFTIEDASGSEQRTELPPGTTRRAVELERGKTYKWNVFTFNCGARPPLANPLFAPFTIRVNN